MRVREDRPSREKVASGLPDEEVSDVDEAVSVELKEEVEFNIHRRRSARDLFLNDVGDSEGVNGGRDVDNVGARGDDDQQTENTGGDVGTF